MRFELYVDRPGLVEKTSRAIEGSPIEKLWVMAERSNGKLLVTDAEGAGQAAAAAHPLDLGFVVWPRDSHGFERYDHLNEHYVAADVEGQDKDGHLRDADQYDFTTSYPFHPLATDEIQVYPVDGGDLEDRRANAILDAMSVRVGRGHTRPREVALPLWGLTESKGAREFGGPRSFLRALVCECYLADVEVVRFWSAKHLWKNDYALPFLTEDLPELAEVGNRTPDKSEPWRSDEYVVARLAQLQRSASTHNKRIYELERRIERLEGESPS